MRILAKRYCTSFAYTLTCDSHTYSTILQQSQIKGNPDLEEIALAVAIVKGHVNKCLEEIQLRNEKSVQYEN